MTATRATLEQNLAEARRNADHARLMIEGQNRIIADLKAMGSDTTGAEKILHTFEFAQMSLATEITRILYTLDTLPMFDGDGQS